MTLQEYIRHWAPVITLAVFLATFWMAVYACSAGPCRPAQTLAREPEQPATCQEAPYTMKQQAGQQFK